MEKKNYLIREYTEFNFQRMNSDAVPQATHVDNPQLSLGSYNRFQMNLATTLQRLNQMFKAINQTNTGVNLRTGDTIGLENIKNIKILRMFQKHDIYLDVYISFFIDDKEYYGVIKKINYLNPEFSSEAFFDDTLAVSREWVIRVKGNIIKAIQNWLTPVNGSYKSLKEIDVINKELGTLILIQEGTIIKVIRTMEDEIMIQFEDDIYILKGKNYYFFNYYFELVDES